MISRHDILDRLHAVGAQPDGEVEPAKTALLLAALDRPDACVDDYQSRLDEIAAATGDEPPPRDIEQRIAALVKGLYERLGYRGDTASYEDMQNANLMSVIDRRKGLPVALGILCMHAARSHGWPIAGVNFPAHFLLELRDGEARAIIDPFDRARPMTTGAMERRLHALLDPAAELQPEYSRPVATRDVLIRLQNNIKIRALHRGDGDRAIVILQGMALFAPEHPAVCFDLATLTAQRDEVRAAITAIEDYHARKGTMEAPIAELLAKLRGRLN